MQGGQERDDDSDRERQQRARATADEASGGAPVQRGEGRRRVPQRARSASVLVALSGWFVQGGRRDDDGDAGGDCGPNTKRTGAERQAIARWGEGGDTAGGGSGSGSGSEPKSSVQGPTIGEESDCRKRRGDDEVRVEGFPNDLGVFVAESLCFVGEKTASESVQATGQRDKGETSTSVPVFQWRPAWAVGALER
ncbi:hypothetical protein ACJZ2D_001576 [Fusarium nematophilum]